MSRVLYTGFTVADVEAVLPFYIDALSCRILHDEIADGDHLEALYGLPTVKLRRVRLALGQEQLQLTQFVSHPNGRPLPTDSRSNDRWFQHVAIVVRDMDIAYDHLQQFDIRAVSQAPQTLPDWNPTAGGIRAFYFRAPDDHVLELIWFPEGKGNPKWTHEGDLFQGIDHTAIAVADTPPSLKFYQALGFSVAGQSENYGIEQAQLNNVENAHLQITGLHADGGFGVEFLQYLTPTDGRAYPDPSYANDLWHWETVVAVESAEAAVRSATEHGGKAVSVLVDGQCLLRDPDGHAIRVVEQPTDGRI